MRRNISILLVAILIFSATLGIAKNINGEKEDKIEPLRLEEIQELLEEKISEVENYEFIDIQPHGTCDKAAFITMGEKESIIEFSIESSNKLKNFLYNWYMNGFIWKILPKYDKNIRYTEEDAEIDISYSENLNKGVLTWILNISEIERILNDFDPNDQDDEAKVQELFNDIIQNATEYLSEGVPHSIHISYTPFYYENLLISNAEFYIEKAIILKLAGINTIYGFGSAYCSVSWSE